jgi:succinate-semialdehyde dehydrogenase/glutarate-semialdehyde dehydrogenase
MYDDYGLFIDGKWRAAADGARTEVLSPVTEQAIGTAPSAGVADTEAALSAAEKGLKAWRRTPAFDRADALHRIADAMLA